MPLFEYACPVPHTIEHYFPLERLAPATIPCTQCGREAVRCFPRVNCLQFFAESSGRIIENLDPGRVLSSHGQHQALMRARGVEPALTWDTNSLKQTDGLKPGNVYPVR
jgi:hypothetical protein